MTSLNSIMSRHGLRYKTQHAIPLNQAKAMAAIVQCRTAALGWYDLKCIECGTKQIGYCSCRNRHCPQCQGNTKEIWVNKRKTEMLPTSYYHIIFTIPSELNPIIQQNQRLMYDILFRASADTLQELAADRKYLGAEIGFMSALHTWGQNLMDHAHIHTLVPAGGISPQKDYWLDVSHRNYFMPVHVVSSLFRGKFMDSFTRECKNGNIIFVGEQLKFKTPKLWNALKNKLYTKGWIVNICPPFSSATTVIEYLSRYLNRVAISNSRIISEDSDQVTFKWKDNRDNQNKTMRLPVFEFIRRFLLHILPERFVKIRYYGFMSNRNRRTNIQKCYQLITFKKKQEPTKIQSIHKANTPDADRYAFNANEQKSSWVCHKCRGSMHLGTTKESRHSPPPVLIE